MVYFCAVCIDEQLLHKLYPWIIDFRSRKTWFLTEISLNLLTIKHINEHFLCYIWTSRYHFHIHYILDWEDADNIHFWIIDLYIWGATFQYNLFCQIMMRNQMSNFSFLSLRYLMNQTPINFPESHMLVFGNKARNSWRIVRKYTQSNQGSFGCFCHLFFHQLILACQTDLRSKTILPLRRINRYIRTITWMLCKAFTHLS